MTRADKSWAQDPRTKQHVGPRGVIVHRYALRGPRGGSVSWYGLYWRQHFYGKYRRLRDAKAMASELLRDHDGSALLSIRLMANREYAKRHSALMLHVKQRARTIVKESAEEACVADCDTGIWLDRGVWVCSWYVDLIKPSRDTTGETAAELLSKLADEVNQ